MTVKRKTGDMHQPGTTPFYIYILLIFLLLPPQKAPATEAYAEKTGKDCIACHMDPSGGGELNEVGKAFQNHSGTGNDTVEKISSGLSILRFIAGYLHIITAVFWFGTILYVHLILKPAYAAGGLPRGEVRVGLFSMMIMLVTGTVLVLFRVSSFELLFGSRFGILLSIKLGLFLMMVATALVAVFFIGPKLRRDKKEGGQKSGDDMSSEALAYFDGKEDRPAYIAYKGDIYDVSKSGIWYGGMHFFRHAAGNDLTGFLSQAPHGEEKILKMPRVEKAAIEGKKTRPPKYERLFYFIAYFNLTMVFLILLILALWRWWG